MADAPALAAIGLIARFLPTVCQRGDDLMARGQMLIASNLAGLAFNASGVGLTHAMAHVVGARYGVHHGTANAICLPHVIRFNADELGSRYADVARALGVAKPGDGEAAGAAAAGAVSELMRRVGLPLRLRDAGVPEGELDACADQSLSDGAIVFNGKFAADKDLVLEVYRAAY
jgi:alcohol dehydrogenase class IV